MADAEKENLNVQSSVEDINEITKQAKVSIPAETVAKEIQSALKDVANNATIKGFRAGKAPAHLVEKLHGERVRREITTRLIASSLSDLMKDLKLDVVGNPEIEISPFEPGAAINYTASISIFPRPEIKGYDKFKVKVPKHEVSDQDVDEVVTRLRNSKATTHKIDGRQIVQAGDVIDASIQVVLEGEKPSRPEPAVLALGEKQLPEEVEKGLLGLALGQSREIVLPMDEKHPNEELRGKKVTYQVTLNGLSEKVLPELDDAFVKSLGTGPETLLELKLDIRKRLEEERKMSSQGDVHEKILEELAAGNSFMVPQALVDDEIRNILVRAGVFDPAKINPAEINVEVFREKFKEAGEKRVRVAIIVDRISEKENLRAGQDDLEKHVNEISERSGLPAAEVKKFLLSKERMINTALEVTRNKVLNFLASRAEVEYVSEVNG
jgi:trigger factor